MIPSRTRHDDLGRFRAYLRLLAEVQLDGRFSAKIDPSDIVQEALLKACRSLEQLRGSDDGQVAAWLRTVLSTTLRDAIRGLLRAKHDVRCEQSLDASLESSSVRLADIFPADASTPSGKLKREERAVEIADAIDALPEDQCRAVVLRHVEGLTLSEAASRMRRSEPSVAGLLRRGLRSLRENLRHVER